MLSVVLIGGLKKSNGAPHDHDGCPMPVYYVAVAWQKNIPDNSESIFTLV
jgi:hypothetical protein